MVRVFVGPSLPAYGNFVLLSTFLKTINLINLSDLETVKGLVTRVGEKNLKNLIELMK